MARTAISKNTHSPTLSRKTTRPDRSPALVIQTAASGTEAQSSWYSGPTAKRKLETFCTEAYQTGKPVDLFGDVDNPLLQIRRDGRNAKGPKEFDIAVEWAKSEWLAVANAVTLGITFRMKIARSKYVILTQHPKLLRSESERLRAELRVHERDATVVAQQEAAIKTLSDIASKFVFISDKLDARADLIQRRFMEAWRRANMPSDAA